MTNPNFAFLNESALHDKDFDEKTEFIVDGLLAKKLITLIYADGGNGKSWLAFALAKRCAKLGLHTVYADFDNPLSVLKERNINELLVNQHTNLQYIQRGKCQHTPQELLTQLDEQAVGNTYSNWVIFIDSLRNFGNVNNDTQIMATLTQLMNIREAGATIVILHHSNKDGKNYQGSNNIRNSIDNMYQLTKLPDTKSSGTIWGAQATCEAPRAGSPKQLERTQKDSLLNLHLIVKKERCSILNGAYQINTQTLAITQLDELQATMTDEIEEFVHTIKQALTSTPNINKTLLLQAAGRKKDDKTARAWLDKFDGTYWQSKKAGGVFTYGLIEA